MTSDEVFLSYSGGILNNCLTNILHINENETDINEKQIIRRLSCYDFDQFSKLAKENKNSFSILSTNILSVNTKFSELEVLEELNTVNFKFSIIYFKETWIDESEDILTKRFSDHQPYFMIMHNTEKLYSILNM